MMSWFLPWMVGPWEEQYWWHGVRDEATFGYGLEVPPNFQMGMPSVHFWMNRLGYITFIFIVIYYFMCIFILTNYYFFNSLSKEWALPYNSLHLSQVTNNIWLIVGAQERFVSWQLNSLINSYVLTLINTV